MFNVGDAVQFNERHKWCGCFGFVSEVKDCGEDVRYMVGVPMPQQGTAYIFTMGAAHEIEWVGKSVFMPAEEGEANEHGG